MERAIDRFDAYMKYVGLNDNKVTVQLGLAVGLIGKSRKMGRDLSRAVIEKIVGYYTDLNSSWLLTGEGSMLNESETENPVVEEPQDKSIADKLFALVESQQRDIKTLLAMLKEKDEEMSRLREELDARKRGCASDVAHSSDATAV